MKRFVAIFAVVLMVVSLFAACGKSDPVGKYVVKSVDGKDVEDYFKDEMGDQAEALLQLMGIESFEEFMTLELKDDKTAVMSTMGEDMTDGEWKQDGSKITITFDGDSMEFELDGSELTGETEEGKITFKKK